MKISPYTSYLELQPNALLVRQKIYYLKKWVLQTYPPLRNLAQKIQEALGNNLV
jgi:hypothetical protein